MSETPLLGGNKRLVVWEWCMMRTIERDSSLSRCLIKLYIVVHLNALWRVILIELARGNEKNFEDKQAHNERKLLVETQTTGRTRDLYTVEFGWRRFSSNFQRLIFCENVLSNQFTKQAGHWTKLLRRSWTPYSQIYHAKFELCPQNSLAGLNHSISPWSKISNTTLLHQKHTIIALGCASIH